MARANQAGAPEARSALSRWASSDEAAWTGVPWPSRTAMRTWRTFWKFRSMVFRTMSAGTSCMMRIVSATSTPASFVEASTSSFVAERAVSTITDPVSAAAKKSIATTMATNRQRSESGNNRVCLSLAARQRPVTLSPLSSRSVIREPLFEETICGTETDVNALAALTNGGSTPSRALTFQPAKVRVPRQKQGSMSRYRDIKPCHCRVPRHGAVSCRRSATSFAVSK